MSETARCDKCRHWGDDEVAWEAQKSGLKHCTAVKERWTIQDEVRQPADAWEDDAAFDAWQARREDALASARAYVEDGSEYRALLWTAPDFFCALFTPATEGHEQGASPNAVVEEPKK